MTLFLGRYAEGLPSHLCKGNGPDDIKMTISRILHSIRETVKSQQHEKADTTAKLAQLDDADTTAEVALHLSKAMQDATSKSGQKSELQRMLSRQDELARASSETMASTGSRDETANANSSVGATQASAETTASLGTWDGTFGPNSTSRPEENMSPPTPRQAGCR